MQYIYNKIGLERIRVLFLDTNAFYYAAGLSNGDIETEKLREYISQNEVAISSVSFYEFLTKFKNEIDKIHKGSVFLSDKHIKIAYNKYFQYHDELRCDFTNISEQELGSVMKIILTNKIDVESRFASIIYDLMLFSGLYFYFMPEGESASDIKGHIFETCFKVFALSSLEVFREIFKEGYDIDNCEKYVRNATKNLLEFSYSVLLPVLDAAIEVQTEEEFRELLDKFDFMGSAEIQSKRIQRCDSSIVYLSKMATKYNKSSKDSSLVNYLEKITQPIIKKIPEKALQEYLKEIASKCCKNGSAFMKNDILDAIILCNIENEHQLITFDNGLLEHMRKYKENRPTYKSSLELIEVFRKQ